MLRKRKAPGGERWEQQEIVRSKIAKAYPQRLARKRLGGREDLFCEQLLHLLFEGSASIGTDDHAFLIQQPHRRDRVDAVFG